MNIEAMVTDLLQGNSSPASYTNDELVEIGNWAAKNDQNKLIIRVAHCMKARGLNNKFTREIW